MTKEHVVVSILALTAAAAYQADNTELNKRDRDGTAMTAEKQSNSKTDIELVAKIRRLIVKDKTLSTSAHNVKIVVNEGNVRLRGPVTSEEERERVIGAAKQIAKDQRAISFLEVIKGDK